MRTYLKASFISELPKIEAVSEWNRYHNSCHIELSNETIPIDLLMSYQPHIILLASLFISLLKPTQSVSSNEHFRKISNFFVVKNNCQGCKNSIGHEKGSRRPMRSETKGIVDGQVQNGQDCRTEAEYRDESCDLWSISPTIYEQLLRQYPCAKKIQT